MRTACVWVYGEAHVERVEREIKESEHPDGDDWMLQRMCLIRRQQSILREA